MMTPVVTCLMFCIFLLGCRSPRSVIETTCKPEFEHEPRPELTVTTRDGNRADAAAQFLVIRHGVQRYRIPWGTPPLTRGPVTLSKHQVYTFTLDPSGQTVLSIRQGEKLIYEAP